MKQLKRTMDYQVRELGIQYMEAVGGDVASHLGALLRAGDFMGIINHEIDPRLYDSKLSFTKDYLANELLRKYPGFPVDIDRRAEAKRKFLESEESCWITNRRLYPYVDRFGDIDIRVDAFIGRVRKKIEFIIGKKPPEITDLCGFGPGSTYEHTGKSILVADKIETIPTRTKYLFGDISHLWIYGQSAFCREALGRDPEIYQQYVKGGRFETVPKNSKVDRAINIEPTLNLYIQKGYGRALRGFLKKARIDLDHGHVRNGVLAQYGSLIGHCATIDLSSASDTVSRSLVELLLPRDWFLALNAARSRLTEIDGKWLLLEKFSSMGNGFTFELETLIFAAICSCVLEDLGFHDPLGSTCLVYGDDIIVPISAHREVVAALSFFGFSTNKRKTFTTGFFRESCGTDAFGGHLIRPCRIDSEPDGPYWWISTANAVRRALLTLPDFHEKRELYMGPWHYAVSQIPYNLRKLIGPERLGDAVLHVDDWSTAVHTGESLSKKFPKDKRFSPHTFWVRALRTVTKPYPWKHWKENIQLATRLYDVGDHSSGHTGRGCPTEVRAGWVSVS